MLKLAGTQVVPALLKIPLRVQPLLRALRKSLISLCLNPYMSHSAVFQMLSKCTHEIHPLSNYLWLTESSDLMSQTSMWNTTVGLQCHCHYAPHTEHSPTLSPPHQVQTRVATAHPWQQCQSMAEERLKHKYSLSPQSTSEIKAKMSFLVS